MKVIVCALLIGTLAISALAERPNAEDVERYGDAEILLVAEVESVRQGPTAMSMPPIYSVKLEVKVTEVLRGTAEANETMSIHYSQRGGAQPRYDAGEQVIIAARVVHRAGEPMPLQATAVIVADEAELAAARKIAAMPIGWTFSEAGKPVSPWAKIDGYQWGPSTMMQCSVTGHPMTATSATLKVEPIIDPDKQIQWTNPDGDGEYRVTVTNPTEEPIFSGLWQVDGQIQWNQSLVILCQGEARTLPGTVSPPRGIVATMLDPGESVSTTVSVLALDGIDWPRGGRRVEFLFALGDRGSTQSFYYRSDHHDELHKDGR